MAVAAALVAGCTPQQPDPEEAPPETEAEEDEPDLALDPDTYCADADGGTLRWVHDHEPEHLLVDPVDANVVAGWVQHGVHEGLYGRSPDGELLPQLVAEDAQADPVEDGRVRLSYELRDDLRFSDGTPLTGETVAETYQLLVTDDGAARLADPGPYERIVPDSWEVDGQRFSFDLDGPYQDWRALFPRVLPTHVLDDVDRAEQALREHALEGGPIPASGPFEVAAWERGSQLELRRNDEYHGAHPDRPDVVNAGPACVERIALSFVDGDDGVHGAVRADGADLAVVAPQEEHAQPRSGVMAAVAPDPAVETWLLNLAAPHLLDPGVREALAASVDRAALVEQVHLPVLGDTVPAQGHGSLVFGPDADQDTQGAAGLGGGDHQRAEQLLQTAGYELNGEGIWEHPERGELELRLATTGGDRLRERSQQQLQTDLNEHGWRIRIDNAAGTEHLTDQVLSEAALRCGEDEADPDDCDQFQISQLSLQPGARPGEAGWRFRSDGGQDPTGLRSASLDALLDRCVADEEPQRSDCLQRLDRTLVTREGDADGLAAIPLALRPHVVLVVEERVERLPRLSPAAGAGPLRVAADVRLTPDPD